MSAKVISIDSARRGKKPATSSSRRKFARFEQSFGNAVRAIKSLPTDIQQAIWHIVSDNSLSNTEQFAALERLSFDPRTRIGLS
jgi:hypothetical protein